MDAPAPDVPNVLVAAPAFGREYCPGLPDAEALVGVAVTRTADRWLDDHGDRLPGELRLVDVGGGTRSATAAGDLPGPGDVDLRVEAVPERGNLTRLGVAITECIESVEGADDAVLCFGAVAPLLQSADGRTVFRFLQVLTDHVRAADVAAHYHLDPGAVDERERARLRLCFDAEVTDEGDDGWTVRTR